MLRFQGYLLYVVSGTVDKNFFKKKIKISCVIEMHSVKIFPIGDAKLYAKNQPASILGLEAI